MTSCEFSVCVLHYGNLALTEACLRSTFDLATSPQERVVVWNDVRTRPSALAADLQHQVYLLEPGVNLGFAGGANLGARHAFRRPDVGALLLLNNDTVLDADSPTKLLEALSRECCAGMVGPRILQLDSRRVWHDGGSIDWPEARPTTRGFGASPPTEAAEDPFDVEFVCGCAPLLRKEAFESVGGFDERYFMFYEDADLSLRMRAKGWRLLHVPRATVLHRGSAATADNEAGARYYRLRNRLLFSREHAPNRDAAQRARRRLRRRMAVKAWKRLIAGRPLEARAIRQALRDAADARWGMGWPPEGHP